MTTNGYAVIRQNWVQQFGVLGAYVLDYLQVLQKHTKDGWCWATRKQLADKVCVGVKKIDRTIKQLKEAGAIKTYIGVNHTRTGRITFFHVMLNEDKPVELPDTKPKAKKLTLKRKKPVKVETVVKPELQETKLEATTEPQEPATPTPPPSESNSPDTQSQDDDARTKASRKSSPVRLASKGQAFMERLKARREARLRAEAKAQAEEPTKPEAEKSELPPFESFDIYNHSIRYASEPTSESMPTTKPIAETETNVEIVKSEPISLESPTQEIARQEPTKQNEKIAYAYDHWEKVMGVKQKSTKLNGFACNRLIKFCDGDVHKLCNVINLLPQMMKEEGSYALRISDFVELEQKWNKVIAWARQKALDQQKAQEEKEALKNYRPFGR